MFSRTVLFHFALLLVLAAALQRRQESNATLEPHRVPNIVLILSDQQRWDWTSLRLPALRTPTFARLAARGATFEHAVVPSPICVPSRASLATGRRYGRSGAADNGKDLDMNATTIYTRLKTAGVHTMTAGKDDLTQKGIGSDGSYRAEQLGFSAYRRCEGKLKTLASKGIHDPYTSFLFAAGVHTSKNDRNTLCPIGGSDYGCSVPSPMPQEMYQDDWVAGEAIKLLEEAPADQPFFLQVNFAGPHPPFIITEAMNKSIESASANYPLAVSSAVPADIQQLVRKNYAAMIENLDVLNGRLLDALDARGVLDDTVVCITSDHGEQLGDFSGAGHDGRMPHGWRGYGLGPSARGFSKAQPWRGSTEVPLVCAGPGIAEGLIISEPVSTLDLSALVLDIMGVDQPADLDSQSLRAVLAGERRPSRPATSAYGAPDMDQQFGIVQAQLDETGHVHKLVCCRGSCPYSHRAEAGNSGWDVKLFDLTDDPYEENDLYTNSDETAAKVASFLAQDLPWPVQDCKAVVRR